MPKQGNKMTIKNRRSNQVRQSHLKSSGLA